MQDFKPRRFPNRRPPARGRFSWLRRRPRRDLPKGFRPLPPPPRPGTQARQSARAALPVAERIRRQPWLRWMYLGLIAWLLLGLGMWGRELWRTPLRRLRISGVQTLSVAQVVRTAGLTAGMRLSEFDPYLVSLRLRQDPRVEAADARRVYPDSVWIDVRERTPELRVLLGDGRQAVVDRGNVVIRVEPAQPGEGPLIRGIQDAAQPGTALASPGLMRARTFLAQAKAAGYPAFVRAVLDVSDPDSIVVSGYGSGAQLIFPLPGVEAALRVYGQMIGGNAQTEVGQALRAAREADFRYVEGPEGGRVFLRP